MRAILFLVFFSFVSIQGKSQSIADYKVQIRLCNEELNEKEASIERYKEVLKKQHSEILELKKKIQKLEQKIREQNTLCDKLKLQNNTHEIPAEKLYKKAQKLDEQFEFDIAIQLYNLTINTFPDTQAALKSRNILRNYKNRKKEVKNLKKKK